MCYDYIYSTFLLLTGSIYKSTVGLNSVFLLLNWLPYQGCKTQSSLPFIHSWENRWIYAFPKGIITK